MKLKGYQDYMDRVRLDEDQQEKLLQALREAEGEPRGAEPETADQKPTRRLPGLVKYASFAACAALLTLVILIQGGQVSHSTAPSANHLIKHQENSAKDAYSGGGSASEMTAETNKKSCENEVTAQPETFPPASQAPMAEGNRGEPEELVIYYKDQIFRIPLAEMDEEDLARLMDFLNDLGQPLVK